ncbi:hypothetical protein GE21DRAFT_5426 [Neurospora crassa]|uniref:Uncharacterized protein n=1 Tax=Neurospora crassa (strain ATCC 24698 / 74-OR23-1A / CBS 708.71 / DSM 1257 / FGSC 987) TaxID=367110 RepID=A7UWJ4_NEUCR|nr:hypothetical protein NCU11067 [Neurospora crassa OR74A]EDO65181.2 hypothetical protein NCU11067 [Neurospora crassa OR74A]KHE85210.1 hypothetical protein GE21DRAFT_5426 [Neurospora crassa]|eukprot:XP_001728272.2 hypothetical protein NCU11067 [Neurospora crassa OR74A]
MPSGVASLVVSKRADGHAHFHKDTKRCATYSRVRAEDNDPREDGLKGVKVESSVLVGRDTRDDTAKRRGGAQDSEQVFRREYKEERSEHTNEDEERRCDKENASGCLASGRDIEVRISRGQTGLDGHAREEHERHDEEAWAVMPTDHPKLELLSSGDKAMGMTISPTEDPETTTLSAADRFLSNSLNAAPIAKPISTPWTSMTCQYLSQRLSSMTHNR